MVGCEVSVIMTNQTLNFEAFLRVLRDVFSIVFLFFHCRRLVFPFSLYKDAFAPFIRSLSLLCASFLYFSLAFLFVENFLLPFLPNPTCLKR